MKKKRLTGITFFTATILILTVVVFNTSLSLTYSNGEPGDSCDTGSNDQCEQFIYGADEPADQEYADYTHGNGIRIYEEDNNCVSGTCVVDDSSAVERADCSTYNEPNCDGDYAEHHYYSVTEDEDKLCCRKIIKRNDECVGGNVFCAIEGGESMCQSNPEVNDLTSTNLNDEDYCSGLDNFTLSWSYYSETGHSHEGSQVIITEEATGDEVETYDLVGSTTSVDVLDDIDYNTTYKWEVQVRDEYGNHSQWEESSFEIEGERADPDFRWNPRPAFKDEKVDFINETTGGDYAINRYEWTFQNADPSSVIQYYGDDDPSTEFTEEGANRVSLEVIEDGFTGNCSFERDVNIRPELPSWQEVDPFR